MRIFVTPVALAGLGVFLLGAAAASLAEAVRLKNGDVIYADQVTETDTKVEYSVGDNTFTIPKARVEHIDRGVPNPVRAVEVPNYTPSAPAAGEEHLLEKVIQEGSVNRESLYAIE